MTAKAIGVYEFARRTGRDVTSLYKLIYAGKIEASKTGRKWLISESQVSSWTLQPQRKGN